MKDNLSYSFHPLPTDLFFYFILSMIIFCVIFTVSRPHLRAPWRRVFVRPMGMISAVIIMFYLMLGTLDSVHFQSVTNNSHVSSSKLVCPSGAGEYFPTPMGQQSVSILDSFFYKINQVSEKRYSAPLALTEYDSNNTKREVGNTDAKYYPKLCYAGGDDLSSSHGYDIVLHMLKGMLFGVLMLIASFLVIFSGK